MADPVRSDDLGGTMKRKHADKNDFSEQMRRGKMAHEDARELRHVMGYDAEKSSKVDRTRRVRAKKGGRP